MKKILTLIGLAALISLSSCGIFHKSCNCPHFGRVDVRMKDEVRIC